MLLDIANIQDDDTVRSLVPVPLEFIYAAAAINTVILAFPPYNDGWIGGRVWRHAGDVFSRYQQPKTIKRPFLKVYVCLGFANGWTFLNNAFLPQPIDSLLAVLTIFHVILKDRADQIP